MDAVEAESEIVGERIRDKKVRGRKVFDQRVVGKEEEKRGALRMSIQTSERDPKKGETLTSWIAAWTKLTNHCGNFTFLMTARIQAWSIESKALAVSRKKTKRSLRPRRT